MWSRSIRVGPCEWFRLSGKVDLTESINRSDQL
jgi:hypothetical protein